jgi:ribosomal protein S18 acetylase RimI-like enzyme
VTVRPLTVEDRELLGELWQAFEAELPPPPFRDEIWDEAWPDVERHIREGLAFLAEEDGRPVGFLLGDLGSSNAHTAHVSDLYVVGDARGRGVGKALLAEAAARARERGLTHVTLDVSSENAQARTIYERLGFREYARFLAVETDALEERMTREQAHSTASVHVQTDDERLVETVVRRFVPRLGGARATAVLPAQSGWIAVYNERADEDREAHRRLARELSDAAGVVVAFSLEQGEVVRFLLYERGRMVDEYLSVPEYYGPLATADALALAANPTLVSRLTGAEPGRVRSAARNAGSPSALPPAPELVAAIAESMGLEGAGIGFAEAAARPGARVFDPANPG